MDCFFLPLLAAHEGSLLTCLAALGRVLSGAIKLDFGAECQDPATQGGSGGQRELPIIEALGSAWLTSSTLTYFHTAIFLLILKQDYMQETGRQACLRYLSLILFL